jgi:DNA helicase-2/ATP-dependent DNA helicase PcrA
MPAWNIALVNWSEVDFLTGLNPQQKEAVTHVEGPLLLLAGAGSGKTRVVTHRIAHLISEHRAPGPAILAVTFTNKAADEMRGRVERLLGDSSTQASPFVSTFHSFCVRLLRRNGQALADIRPGFTTSFNIYDDDDQLSLIKSIYRELGLDEKSFLQYRAALSRISHAKNHKQTPDDFYKASKDPKMSRLAVVFDRYEARLRQANALDFDDLLLESVRLLRHDDQTRGKYNRRFEFLNVDEYQDTNRSQYELIRLLTEAHKNLCVVGDEDQSIYGWRGANIKNILDFEKDYPDTRIIRLEQNYRSTKNILEVASTLIAKNTQRKGKWLWTEHEAGPKVGLYDAYDAENEALWIADTIERHLGRNPNDRVAVLYRTNFQSRQIEEALRRYNRKYLIVGGFSFYQRAEVKDLIAYLKALASPHDSISLLRILNVPARGIGKSTAEQMEQYALEHNLSLWSAMGEMLDRGVLPTRAEAAVRAFQSLMNELRHGVESRPVNQTLEAIIERTGYRRMLNDGTPDSESRLGNIEELVNAAADAAERGEGLADFLDHAALVSEADALDESAQVSLLTVHNAKGLEFPVVFIAGLEEGLFPHIRSVLAEDSSAADKLEEERRLCYVAMTRAEKRLYLSWAKFRRRYGGGSPEQSIPSRFLQEVPSQLIEPLNQRAAAAREVDLYAEQHEARETVRKNLYTGKTYNSLDNIAQFFSERGMPAPRGIVPPAQPLSKPAHAPVARPAAAPVRKTKPFGPGSSVNHPKYGRGTVLRKEGDGEDAKLTVSFPGYGLKKLIQKYAGISPDE